LAFDDDGDLWVSNAVSGLIQEYDSDGILLGSTAALDEPSDITWHDGALYVAEHGTSRIIEVNPTDYGTSEWIEVALGDNPADLYDLAFAPGGALVVTGGGTSFRVDTDHDLHAFAGTAGANTMQGVFFRGDDCFISVGPRQIIQISGPF